LRAHIEYSSINPYKPVLILRKSYSRIEGISRNRRGDDCLDGDLTILFIGAVIAIISSIVTYWVNHFLRLREQRILREFEIREKGREFYHRIYGIVAILSDYVTSFLQDSGNAMVLTEDGYVLKPKNEIIKKYQESYEKYSTFWFESREKGLEVFIPKSMAKDLAGFWGYAGYFHDVTAWSEHPKFLTTFKEISQTICDDIDRTLGITERKSRKPKWLNPKKWRIIRRSGQNE